MKRILFALVVCFLPCSVFAEDTHIDRYRAITAQFLALYPPQGIANNVPRLGDPDTDKLFAAMSDLEEFLVSPVFQKETTNNLSEICEYVNKATVNYLLLGMESRSLPPEQEEKIQFIRGFMTSNSHVYQDELSHLLSFQVNCGANQARWVMESAKDINPEDLSPVRKAAVMQMRQGVMGLFIGALTTVLDPLIREPNAMRLLKAVNRSAGTYSKVLTLKEREVLLTVINDQRKEIGKEGKNLLDGIVLAVSDKSCTGFCRF